MSHDWKWIEDGYDAGTVWLYDFADPQPFKGYWRRDIKRFFDVSTKFGGKLAFSEHGEASWPGDAPEP